MSNVPYSMHTEYNGAYQKLHMALPPFDMVPDIFGATTDCPTCVLAVLFVFSSKLLVGSLELLSTSFS
jgi:hypothetical protein